MIGNYFVSPPPPPPPPPGFSGHATALIIYYFLLLLSNGLECNIYGYMASDIWLRTILIVRKETRCRHIGYSYRLTARVILYAPSHRQDNTYHGLCYTSRGALAGTRNSSMGPPHEGSISRQTDRQTNRDTYHQIYKLATSRHINVHCNILFNIS